jgi:Tfp pilus assembly protein PilZ
MHPVSRPGRVAVGGTVIATDSGGGQPTMENRSVRPESRRLPVVRIAGTPETSPDLNATVQPLVDLSRSGCAVQTEVLFRQGEEFYLAFSVSECLQFLVPVRVSYSRPAFSASAGQPAFLTGFEYNDSRQPDVHRVIEILLETTDIPLSVH